MQDASGSTTYSYDNRDRLLSKATPQGTLSYSYDPAGNLTRIQSNHAGGAAMDYAYDPRNRLASVTDAEGRVTTYSYDAVGNLAGFLYPNGVQTTYTYNLVNRLTNVTGARGATTIAGYTYTLGPSGNRTAVTEASGRRVDYTYDEPLSPEKRDDQRRPSRAEWRHRLYVRPGWQPPDARLDGRRHSGPELRLRLQRPP
jgi:YD repeat-containing protein